MTDKTQPEALRLADHLERFRSFPDDLAAAAELRRLHVQAAQDESLLRQVLEALEAAASDDQPYIVRTKAAIAALRERLEVPNG